MKPRSFEAFPLIFAASGAACLAYETAWARMVLTPLGSHALAGACVVAAALAGLGLGSALGGFLVRIPGRNPLRTFAWIEAGVLLAAGAVPVLIGKTSGIPMGPYQGGLLVPWQRLWIVVMSQTPAFLLLGAGFPFLLLATKKAETGRVSVTLYGFHAAGGLLSCAICTYWLIPAQGADAAQGFGLMLSAAGSGISLLLSSRVPSSVQLSPEPETYPGPERAFPLDPGWALAVAASGFLSASCQVLVMRCFLLGTGSTPYATGLGLVAGLLGVVLGACLAWAIAPRWAARTEPAILCGMLGGLLAWAWAAVGDHAPYIISRYFGSSDAAWVMIQAESWLAATVLVVPPMAFLSAVLPLALRGSSAGAAPRALLLAANALGSGLGALSAGIILIPNLGLARAIGLISGLALGLSAAALTFFRIRSGRKIPWLVAASAALGALPPLSVRPWNMRAYQAGAFTDSGSAQDGLPGFSSFGRHGHLVVSCETATATMGIFQNGPHDMSLVVNGHAEASLADHDMRNQKLLGHLPALLSRAQERSLALSPSRSLAVVVGWGTGMTARALARHPFSVEVAEITPEVQALSKPFEDFDLPISENRPRLIPGDGRLIVESVEPGQMAVITSDPFNPWSAGSGNLYSIEYFQAARRALEPGGVMALWVPLYQLPAEETLRLAATFASVFPESTLWFMGGDAILTGETASRRSSLRSDWAPLWTGVVAEDLRLAGFDSPDELLATAIPLGNKVLERMHPGPLNSDRHPMIEFASARALRRLTIAENTRFLQTLVPAGTGDAGFLASILKAHSLIWEGRFRDARGEFEAALISRPGSSLVRRMYGESLLHEAWTAYSQGDIPTLFNCLSRAKGLGIEGASRFSAWGTLLASVHSCDEAEGFLKRALELRPDDAQAWTSLGACSQTSGDTQAALRAFEKAAQSEPWRWEHWRNLGMLRERSGDQDGARQAYGEALRLNPSFQAPRAGGLGGAT